ncbi:MAG TPA: DUF1707 domain-containing protein [Tessaracoccus flavescens]|uniref:DUF1707 domain-containing protein n=1 Tax=Tessaracoccus flavescens TaxID=399497 RepID=A0A921JSB2_9ACTN|nr:DUF1707 domain-containing protein [Tessaracoccus flavescens]
MARNPANDKVRVSNIQRENAVTALRDASGAGLLTFDELDERVAAALTAIVRGDLIRLLEDLIPEEDLDTVIADPLVQGEGPGFRWDDPLVIRSGDDSVKTEGNWDIPPFIELLVGGTSIRLDCVEATPLAQLIDITIVADGWAGSVHVIIPEGWGVDTQHVMTNTTNSSVSSKVRTRPSGTNPRLVLRGRISGRVVVRYPNYWDRRRLAKRHAQAALEAQRS